MLDILTASPAIIDVFFNGKVQHHQQYHTGDTGGETAEHVVHDGIDLRQVSLQAPSIAHLHLLVIALGIHGGKEGIVRTEHALEVVEIALRAGRIKFDQHDGAVRTHRVFGRDQLLIAFLETLQLLVVGGLLLFLSQVKIKGTGLFFCCLYLLPEIIRDIVQLIGRGKIERVVTQDGGVFPELGPLEEIVIPLLIIQLKAFLDQVLCEFPVVLKTG